MLLSARSLKPPALTNMPTLHPLICGLMSTTFSLTTLTPLYRVAAFAGVGSAEHVTRGLRCTLLAAGVHPSPNVWEVVSGSPRGEPSQGRQPTKSTPRIIQANNEPVFFLNLPPFVNDVAAPLLFDSPAISQARLQGT